MENLIEQLEGSMKLHDWSYGQNRINMSPGYILACVKNGRYEDAETESVVNGDKLSKQSHAVLKQILKEQGILS